jgi:hypothetical protein
MSPARKWPRTQFNTFGSVKECPVPATTLDQFKIAVTYQRSNGLYFGKLRVQRTTDGALLFPFDGAPEIGPYPTGEEAVEAARLVAKTIAEADLRCPE